MRDGGLAFLTLFGAAAVLFGLWLRPKWRRVRRERLRRGDVIFLSRGRELWLWLNTFASIAFGAILIGVVLVEMGERLREQAREAELARFDFHCDQHQLTVENRGDSARRIRLSSPQLLQSTGRLMEEPERWKASFDGEAERMLAPGERASVGVTTTPGVCAAPSVRLTLFQPDVCDLAFDFASDRASARVSCRIQ